MGTRWRGLMAPLDVSTGDRRRLRSGGATWRELPLPLKWQRSETVGHDDSVTIGATEHLGIMSVADAVSGGWISADGAALTGLPDDALGLFGIGQVFDDVNCAEMGRLCEDVAESMTLLHRKVVGLSVDPGMVNPVYAEQGSDEPLTEERYEELWWQAQETGEPMPVELLFMEYEVAGGTLVQVPAFAQCQPLELLTAEQEAELPELALTAAVRSTGWSDLPLASRDVEWDGAAADAAMAQRCGLDGEDPDWPCYAAAHLYQDDDADPQTQGAYSFGIVDTLDGEPHIIPRAVFAVASVLEGGRGGTDIPEDDQERMRQVVSGLYARMREEFDDDSLRAPWDTDDDAAASSRATASLVAAVGATRRPPPVELFANPGLSEWTHLTVGEPVDGWVPVFGHVAGRDTCHVGIPDVCMLPPHSQTGYEQFHRYTRTAAGIELPLPMGRVTTGRGRMTACACHPNNDDHACGEWSMGAAISHHDRMVSLAWGVVGEDETNNAIYFAGVLDPDADPDAVAVLGRRKWSGDWREYRGNLELVELLALAREKPGFPPPRATARNGRTMSLTAAGTVPLPRPDTAVQPGVPAWDYERLSALIAKNLATAFTFPGVVLDPALLTRSPDTTPDPAAAQPPTPQPEADPEQFPEQQAAALAAEVDQVLGDVEAAQRAREAAALLHEVEVA